MKIEKLVAFLENHAPLYLQEDYDNAGLLVGDDQNEISSVLVSLDTTEAVIDEAIEMGANVVVAHHPIIFSGLRKITGANYIERAILKAIKNDIAIYAIHTNLDNVYQNGVNTKICEKLGLSNLQILLPKKDILHNNQAVGAGMIGEFHSAIAEKDFLKMLKEQMKVSVIKHTALLGKEVRKVAVCGGSGRFLLTRAIAENADIFISSDFKYHEYFDANNQIVIADIGHYESEQFTIDLLVGLINDNFSNFAAHFTKTLTNPVNYF